MIIQWQGGTSPVIATRPPAIPQTRRQGWVVWEHQIRIFAEAFLRTYRLPRGKITILDAGCGIGSALPIFRTAYPEAELFGCDLDPDHILECEWRWGTFAKLACEDVQKIEGYWSVIYLSNVLEHLDEPWAVARRLSGMCDVLYVMVPYRETCEGLPITAATGGEHKHFFTEQSFDRLCDDSLQVTSKVVRTPGAWGITRRRELAYRAKAVLQRRPFDKQRQIIYRIAGRLAL